MNQDGSLTSCKKFENFYNLSKKKVLDKQTNMQTKGVFHMTFISFAFPCFI